LYLLNILIYTIIMNKGASAVYFTLFDEFFQKKPTKSERRRLQIIEKSISELATSGLDSTTHESLAKACGISRALVQHYFPDRDELFLIAFRFVRAKFQKLCVDELIKQSSPQDQLKIYIEMACSWPKLAPQDAKVWLLFYYYSGIKIKYRRLNTELVNQGHARISALLEEGAKARGIKLTQPNIRAKLIQNAITSYYLSALTEEQNGEMKEKMFFETVQLCLSLAGIYQGFIHSLSST